MRWQTINLNMDGSVAAQNALLKQLDTQLDLTAHQNILRLYANRRGHDLLRQSIESLRQSYPGPWLTFLGSGDFNHVSAFLIESLPETTEPVSLVLIDNHPDWFDMPLQYHCATWVSTLLKHNKIETATLIGMDSIDLRGHELWFVPFADFCSGRVQVIPYEQEFTQVPLRWANSVRGTADAQVGLTGTSITFDTIAKLGIKGLCQNLINRLAGKNVYICIDKDVLTNEYAVSDWEHGRLTLPQLQEILEALFSCCHIIGADICGEKAPKPLHGPWKRWDAGRLGQNCRSANWNEINELNTKTNLSLVDTFKALTCQAKLA